VGRVTTPTHTPRPGRRGWRVGWDRRLVQASSASWGGCLWAVASTDRHAAGPTKLPSPTTSPKRVNLVRDGLTAIRGNAEGGRCSVSAAKRATGSGSPSVRRPGVLLAWSAAAWAGSVRNAVDPSCRFAGGRCHCSGFHSACSSSGSFPARFQGRARRVGREVPLYRNTFAGHSAGSTPGLADLGRCFALRRRAKLIRHQLVLPGGGVPGAGRGCGDRPGCGGGIALVGRRADQRADARGPGVFYMIQPGRRQF